MAISRHSLKLGPVLALVLTSLACLVQCDWSASPTFLTTGPHSSGVNLGARAPTPQGPKLLASSTRLDATPLVMLGAVAMLCGHYRGGARRTTTQAENVRQRFMLLTGSAGSLTNPRTSVKPVRAEGEVVAAAATPAKKGGFDFVLLAYFALWYLGNYYYNVTNKLALNAAGGASGYPMTIATLQLGVGVIWALLLWGYPDTRKLPEITFDDFKKTLLVGLCSAGAHAASVFALSAGAVSFGQIVKAAEPAFAALVGTLFYSAKVSTAKWLCLIPVIGGVVLASLGELDFAWAALITAGVANVFAAFKGNENKKLMDTAGLKDRIGSVGNQFALSTINSFMFCVIIAALTEGYKFGGFVKLATHSPVVLWNLIYSGLWFYAYNEVATKTIEKTSAVAQSVANTAKRVIVIVGVAIILGESLEPIKLIGCAIGIGGVFLYSIVDSLVKPKK